MNAKTEKKTTVNILEEELVLLPEKAIFWKRTNALLLADLHLGKSGHFRKAGIPVSSRVHHHDLERLSSILSAHPVEKIYLLGDLFHSRHNNEWEQFIRWRNQYPALEFHLVKGNHDILLREQIDTAGILLHPDKLEVEPFIFSHQSIKEIPASRYLFSGHIHPSVMFDGKGLQSLSLPCYWFGRNQCILPAFGEFNGNAIIFPRERDKVFVIMNGRVIATDELAGKN